MTIAVPIPCKIEECAACDASGQTCDSCFMSEPACECEDPDFAECFDCEGTGVFCRAHESPFTCGLPFDSEDAPPLAICDAMRTV